MKVDGLCALVTGGASGLGKHLVGRLLSLKVKFIAVVDVNKASGEAALKEFNSQYGEGRVRFISCDVRSQDEVKVAFKDAFTEYNRLDLLVNCAGVASGPDVIKVNLEGVIHCCEVGKQYISKKKEGHGGIVINFSSIGGIIPFWNPIYAASKYGVVGYSLTLAECDPVFSGNNDCRIVVICPAVVETPFVQLRETEKSKLNFVRIDQVSDACVMAIEDDSKHACCIRITPAFGIDLLPMKSSKELQEEAKIWKE